MHSGTVTGNIVVANARISRTWQWAATSFPVGGMYVHVKGIGRLTKKKSLASLFHCFLNVKSTLQILSAYLTGKEKPVREAQH